MKKKVLLYYNPKSGSGVFTKNLDKIVDRVQKEGYQLIVMRACESINFEEELANIDESQYRQIIVAGGDGTINICVNAMIKNNISLPLAIFPAGTANDFAGYFQLPSNIDELLDIAMGSCITTSDVGTYNDKYFVNVAALGNLVDVSQKTNPAMKNALGIFAYYLKGASELVKLRALPVKLITPEKVYEEEMFFMVVMNGVSAGGFKRLAPASEVNDGKLNVILFRKMPITEFAPLFLSVIRGTHTDRKNVLTFETDKLIIESSEDISTDIDGEHGEKLPLTFGVLEKRLNIFTREKADIN